MSEIKVLDGGFSTQLSTHLGEKINGDPLWTARFLITKPEAVFATHLDFLRAGADIIETNTYQATIDGFIKHLSITEEESLEIIRKAVDYAKDAVNAYSKEIENDENVRNRKPLIAGSCGPYGACLHDGSEYTGSYCINISREFLINWHRPRIRALLERGVDLLAIETIPCVREAEAIIDLLKEFPDTRAWLSFSCRDDGKSLADGNNFQEIAVRCYKNALPGQILAIGVNCIAPQCVTALLQDINKNKLNNLIPLVVYPNSGEKYTVPEGWKKEGKTPSLHEFIDEWLDLGVRYIGGCCRTYATDIKRIRSRVDQRQT
ncbi:Homocysteine S-methyltransferase ybgG [Trachymyrmex zeteki]|uniref:Homocysteine S-methyltransferase ybgG n=1 Tax=Mycetomoellerius zeteki TaxID=64791 RepID=A0A151WY87_9HYME|nr:PREDICTED: homocysteine S-methyltransferase YbgG-like [Trachymyrmex zeteki]KYQ52661.1 Homocysteine S-methyltransferase ybgG [Trachymyrmex zeteki]